MSQVHSTIDEYRRTLDRAVEKLQEQTTAPLWLFADGAAVRAVAFDRPYRFGTRGRIVYWIFKRLDGAKSSFAILWVVGFLVVLRWWLAARLAKPVAARGVFVGTGAGSEQQLFERFQTEIGSRPLRVAADDPTSWGAASQPDFRCLISLLSAESRRVHDAIVRSADPAVRDRGCMWMALSAMRIGRYTFARAWAATLPRGTQKVVFLSVDVYCFAAVDARTHDTRHSIEYWQHGLLYRTLVFPTVDRVVALDAIEALHIERLSRSPGVIRPPAEVRGAGPVDTLLFASIYDAAGFEKQRHISLLSQHFAWAAEQGLRVVVRPHPREDASFWPSNFPRVEVHMRRDAFESCVARWKPLFVTSWFSTALIDALRLGVAPILLTEGSILFLRDMVLPLEQIAMNWPAHRGAMEDYLRDRIALQQWVERRKAELFASPIVSSR